MTIRTITGNINTLAGVDIPNATFSLVPETYIFGSTSTEVVFGEQITVEADANGDVSFNLHEGKYVGRISTSQGAKSFRLTVDSEGPWTLGRLVGKLDPVTSSLAAQIFDAAEAANLSAQQSASSASTATTQAGIATTQATEAKQARDQAVAIAAEDLPSTVVLTAGDQTIAGVKTFTGQITGSAVTQSPTDTTEGRLLKVGDFGYGVERRISGGSVDDLIDLGKYNFSTANRPSGLPISEGGTVEVFYDQFGFFRQHFYPRGNSRQWVRNGSGDPLTWGNWVEVFTQNNILGTVSQSAGVPTGAIIQRGSNSNGEFVRFADGTQICWGLAEADLTSTSNQTYTFPASFSSNGPIACAASIQVDGLFSGTSNNNAVATAAIGTGHTSFGSWIFRVNQPGTLSSTNRLRLSAIGRWF